MTQRPGNLHYFLLGLAVSIAFGVVGMALIEVIFFAIYFISKVLQ